MAFLELKHIFKDYIPGTHAVCDVNLEIEEEEFLVLVGPSGCGKSTTLRMIAGLEDITSGEIVLKGKVINDLHPKDRDMAMVFQNYALYPHMTVRDNLSFGLKMKKTSKKEMEDRVLEAARLLDIEEYLDRKPKELSGGQRQRVALGRAIVRKAALFLMDEPLSNLDAKLRTQTRAELIKLHRDLKTTTIYVTHDQTEAMTMATRIVVMKDGLIQQVGSPRQVYGDPENEFVAGFIGSPGMNFFNCRILEEGVKIGDTSLKLPENMIDRARDLGILYRDIRLGIRPENFSIDLNEGYGLRVNSEITELTGSESLIHFNIDGEKTVAKVSGDALIKDGEEIYLSYNPEKLYFFNIEDGERIRL